MKNRIFSFLEDMKDKILHFFFFGQTKREKVFRLLFTLSMILKCIDGVFELVGGLTFEILKKESILKMISTFLKHEKTFQIPNETILKWVTSISHVLSTNLRLFLSIILIGNGIIKIVLSISLLLRKYIAFPIALIFLTGLYVYQIVQTIYTPSPFLYFLDAFDLAVILVILKEYMRLKKEKKFHI